MINNGKLHHLIEAVVYIALHAKPNAVRGPEICKAQNLPERYLESDLQKLVRKGILRSVRGPRGGYVLAKERRNITLAEIYLGTDCQEDYKNNDYIARALKTAEEKYTLELAKITIEQLCIQAGQGSENRQKPDFII